jgi:hypothetical protein
MFSRHAGTSSVQERRSPQTSVTALFVLLELGCLSLCPRADAQTVGTGALSGNVSDPSGAAIADAQIGITSETTGEIRMVKSGADGNYLAALLLPGLYEVEVTKSGFKTTRFTQVRIFVTETVTLNARQQIGAISERILVEAEAEQLQRESSIRNPEAGDSGYDMQNVRDFRRLMATATLYSSTARTISTTKKASPKPMKNHPTNRGDSVPQHSALGKGSSCPKSQATWSGGLRVPAANLRELLSGNCQRSSERASRASKCRPSLGRGLQLRSHRRRSQCWRTGSASYPGGLRSSWRQILFSCRAYIRG